MTKREEKFRKAARQVILILDNFEGDRDRVDKEVMYILKKNMDMSLKWSYNTRRKLSEQSGLLDETYTLMSFLLKNYIWPKRYGGNHEEKDKLEKLKQLLDKEESTGGEVNVSEKLKTKKTKTMYENMLANENINKVYGYDKIEEGLRLYKKISCHTEQEAKFDRYELMMKQRRYKTMLSEDYESSDDYFNEYDLFDLFGEPYENNKDDRLDKKYDRFKEKREFYKNIIQIQENYEGAESLDFMEWLREKYKVFMRKESETV